MAKRRTHTLSEQQAKDLPQVMLRVLGDGGSGGTDRTTKQGRADGAVIGMWVKFTASSADGFGYAYTGDLFPAIAATDSLSTGLAIVNSWELENTESFRSGYEISGSPACGDIKGIDPLPNGTWFQVTDVMYVSGARKLVVSHQNTPTIELSGAEGSDDVDGGSL